MGDSPRWSGGPSSSARGYGDSNGSHSWSGGPIGARHDEARFGVRCPQCARTQPGQPATPAFAGQPGQPRYAGLPTSQHCVYCGATLAVTRWVATPPPGLGPPPRVRRIARPYTGPPSYGPSHPPWGFPPVAKRLPVSELHPVPAPPLRLTAVAMVAAFATGLACLLAAGAEAWRYGLMLTGRFEVLPARPVSLNAALVTASSWVSLGLAALALLVATRAMQVWSVAAAGRAGVLPPRSPGAIAARMLIPGWQLYGAGQVVVEVRELIRAGITGPWSDADRDGARGGTALLAAAWCAWLLNGLLALTVGGISLLPLFSERWAASNQLAANLVLLHAALDVLAALVAMLAGVVLGRLRTEWRGGRALRYEGWLVAQPASTARNRRDAAEDPGAGADGDDGESMTKSSAVEPMHAVGDGSSAAGSSSMGGNSPPGLAPGTRSDDQADADPAAGERGSRDRSADARAQAGQHRRRE